MLQEWLEWRRQGIGASDAPVIMGVSPYKTINQLWKEKVIGVETKTNVAMERGLALEDPALNFFMTETGFFLETQVRKEHPIRPWMRATLDGYDQKNGIVVEIKSCHHLHEDVPPHYYPQLQHQMEVSGVNSMYYMSFDGTTGKILEVRKDPSYIDEMVKKEGDFWESIRIGCRDMSSNEDWKAHVEGIKLAKEMATEAKELESFHLSQLILFSDGCPARGEGITLLKKKRKGSIDYGAIPCLKEIDLELFRKSDSEYWQVEFENKKVDC